LNRLIILQQRLTKVSGGCNLISLFNTITYHLRPGRDADPSPPSSAEVKNRVELYLYCP